MLPLTIDSPKILRLVQSYAWAEAYMHRAIAKHDMRRAGRAANLIGILHARMDYIVFSEVSEYTAG